MTIKELKPIELEAFVEKLLQVLSDCRNVSRQVVYGCIQTLREHQGYDCVYSDDVLYSHFSKKWGRQINY